MTKPLNHRSDEAVTLFSDWRVKHRLLKQSLKMDCDQASRPSALFIAVDAEAASIRKAAAEFYQGRITEWAAMVDNAKNLGKQFDLSTFDVLTDSEGIMKTTNSEKAAALKVAWSQLKDVLDFPQDLKTQLDLEDEVEPDMEEDVTFIRSTIANIMGARALHRPLKASEKRAEVVATALKNLEAVGGNVDPRIALALNQVVKA